MKLVNYVIKKLEKNNFEAFIVGGYVRDTLLKIKTFDIDITTNATPLEIKDLFKNIQIIETGIKHGTLILLKNNEKIEITTYRIESEYVNNRKPKNIIFTNNLIEDLKRRDFTINSICYNKNTGYIDYFNGISDIKNKIIRCIGNPDKRFNEDALRILRAIRFSSTLNFKIEKNTEQSIFKNKELLKNISIERKQIELIKILNSENYEYILNKYKDIFNVFIPNINVENIYGNIYIKIALLFKNSDINLLRLDNKTLKRVKFLIENKDITISNKVDIKKILKFDELYLQDLLIIKNNKDINKLYNEIKNNNEPYKLNQLDITYKDLLDIGINNNQLSFYLNKCLDFIIENPTNNNKQILLNYIKNYI